MFIVILSLRTLSWLLFMSTFPAIKSPPPHHILIHQPIHSPACPSTQIQIRPQLKNTGREYMILLLLSKKVEWVKSKKNWSLINSWERVSEWYMVNSVRSLNRNTISVCLSISLYWTGILYLSVCLSAYLCVCERESDTW